MPFSDMTVQAKMDVAGIGACTLDHLWLVDDFQAGEGVRQAIAHAQMGGGPVATALCVLAALTRNTALVDVCGDDAAGSAIRAELDRYGVSTRWVQQVKGARSAQATVQVRASDGARQIIYLPASAGEPVFEAESAALIRGSRLLHLNGRHERAAREAVRVAQESGVTISFDGGAGRYRDSIRDLVYASHLRVVSREFAQCFSGSQDRQAMMESLMEGNARLVVITEGTGGSYGWVPGGVVFHQPAVAACRVVDTTGCGDVYHGALIHGWLSDWEAPRCMAFASEWAARNAEGLGGRHVCHAGLLG